MFLEPYGKKFDVQHESHHCLKQFLSNPSSFGFGNNGWSLEPSSGGCGCMISIQNSVSPLTPLSFSEKFVETSASSVPSTPEPAGLDCTVVSADTESGRDSPVDVSSTSEPGLPSQSHSSGRRSPSRNPLLQEVCTSEELRNVTCHLETKDLWDKFNELGTEMIITKTGR